jgi:hypothetical protein
VHAWIGLTHGARSHSPHPAAVSCAARAAAARRRGSTQSESGLVRRLLGVTLTGIDTGAANNGNAVLDETKCYSQLVTTVSYGYGQTKTGGKPSTAMGHRVGFGCTEERLLYMTLGCKERGDPSQGTFDHATGDGWVKAHEGHYNDAIHNKHISVKVMIFDDLGDATPGTAKTIRGLAKNVSGKGARDATDYGESHTKCFYQHHSTAISLPFVHR